MFDELAPVHDRLATILSLGLDRRWRAAVVAQAHLEAGDSAIDVAAGTGLLAAELAERVGPFGRVVAVDLSPAMVERGTARARDIVQLEFLIGDALALPFDDGRFGAATIAFGLGTLSDPVAALRELRRVVRPGGRVVCLEPTMPSPRWWGRLQHRTARRLAPLAVSVTARRDAYQPPCGDGAERPGRRIAGRSDAGQRARRRPLPPARARRGRAPRGTVPPG